MRSNHFAALNLQGERRLHNLSTDWNSRTCTEAALLDDNRNADCRIVKRTVADEPAVIRALRIFGGASLAGNFIREADKISGRRTVFGDVIQTGLHELNNPRLNGQFADEFGLKILDNFFVLRDDLFDDVRFIAFAVSRNLAHDGVTRLKP